MQGWSKAAVACSVVAILVTACAPHVVGRARSTGRAWAIHRGGAVWIDVRSGG
jgi:hypothetical protein